MIVGLAALILVVAAGCGTDETHRGATIGREASFVDVLQVAKRYFRAQAPAQGTTCTGPHSGQHYYCTLVTRSRCYAATVSSRGTRLVVRGGTPLGCDVPASSLLPLGVHS